MLAMHVQAMTTLSADEARRLTLGAQGLIAPFASELEAVRACIAVQTQYAASLSMAVAARARRAKPAWDERALQVDGPLVKGWSLRRTLHAHLMEDHSLVLAALGARFRQGYVGWMEGGRRGLGPGAVERLEAQILIALARGPMTRRQLHEAVPELRDIEMTGWGADVMGLAFAGKLCVVGRGAEQRFALCEASEGREGALAELARRYFASYGPASAADFAYWTGLRLSEVREAIEASGATPVQVEGLRGTRYLVGEPAPAEGPLGVRLLAKFDPLTMGHREKSLFIPPDRATRVFRKAGQVEAGVLSQGMFVGTWRLARAGRKGTVVVEPFRALKAREEAGVWREAERLRKALGLAGVEVREV